VVDGNQLLKEGTQFLNVDLSLLVARCSIWVHPDVFHRVNALRPNAVWFPNCRRAWTKRGEKAKTRVDGVHLDDNSKANLAIKQAIFAGAHADCRLMHACHIWPGTCYDTRYHTALANIVLLPAPLAGLSDYDTMISSILRFRSFELFGWHPAEVMTPERPEKYPNDEIWRPFIPIQPSILARIKRFMPIQ